MSYLPEHLQEQNRRSKEKSARRASDRAQEATLVCRDGTKSHDDTDPFAGLTEMVARDFGLQVKNVLVPPVDNPSEARAFARTMEGKRKARVAFALEMKRRRNIGEPTGTDEDWERWFNIIAVPDGFKSSAVIGNREPKTITDAEMEIGLEMNRANGSLSDRKRRRQG